MNFDLFHGNRLHENQFKAIINRKKNFLQNTQQYFQISFLNLWNALAILTKYFGNICRLGDRLFLYSQLNSKIKIIQLVVDRAEILNLKKKGSFLVNSLKLIL